MSFCVFIIALDEGVQRRIVFNHVYWLIHQHFLTIKLFSIVHMHAVKPSQSAWYKYSLLLLTNHSLNTLKYLITNGLTTILCILHCCSWKVHRARDAIIANLSTWSLCYLVLPAKSVS